MKIVSGIVSLVSIIVQPHNDQVNKYLELEINDQGLLLHKQDITDKLLAKSDDFNKELKTEGLNKFIQTIGKSFLRLNHLGISYACNNFDSEILFYKNLLMNSNFSLYEEPSGDANSKWLFIGDISDWQSPLFEIVLTKNIKELENIWRPHFQIDIDTNLKQDNLESYLIDCFGKDFIQWKLDIPNNGVVLEMGMLGSVSGTKIYLGVGTNLRNTKYHREEILKKV